jgi:hypothetical protein
MGIALDDVQVYGSRLPIGSYEVQIVNSEIAENQKGVKTLRYTVEVVSGEHKGLTHEGQYWLGVRMGKKTNIPYSFGLNNFVRDIDAIGFKNKLPKNFDFVGSDDTLSVDPLPLKMVLGKHVKGTRFTLIIKAGTNTSTNSKGEEVTYDEVLWKAKSQSQPVENTQSSVTAEDEDEF